jgi:hypothetical protein
VFEAATVIKTGASAFSRMTLHVIHIAGTHNTHISIECRYAGCLGAE